MPAPAPTSEQTLAFYRAALPVARRLDQDSEHRVLDADADAAWRAYGGDLPTAVRCDLVLRNFAMLYPAAFAPGPVFRLPGWYDDDPWGKGFDRPPASVVEALFAVRGAPAHALDAFDQALSAWGLPAGAEPDPRLVARLDAGTNLIVTGPRAVVAVARVFLGAERLSLRSQAVIVAEQPEARHVAGIACALQRGQGVPLLADPARRPDETAAQWAAREQQRLGVARARILAVSPDAAPSEVEAARALAAALGADEILEIAQARGAGP